MAEIEDARSRGGCMLPVLGLRTALDLMCNDMWGDIGTFEAKLRKLADEGLVGTRQLLLLMAAVEIGNATTHRGHVPSQKDATAVYDIIEGLLKQHYVLPDRARRASRRVPPKRIPRR
jgi:hypothetical protein